MTVKNFTKMAAVTASLITALAGNVMAEDNMSAPGANYGMPQASESSSNQSSLFGGTKKGSNCFSGFSTGIHAVYSSFGMKMTPGTRGGTFSRFGTNAKLSPNSTQSVGLGAGISGNAWMPLSSGFMFGVGANFTVFSQKRGFSYSIPYADTGKLLDGSSTGDNFLNVASSRTEFTTRFAASLDAKLGYMVSSSAMVYGSLGFAWRTLKMKNVTKINQIKDDAIAGNPDVTATFTYKGSQNLPGLRLGLGTVLALQKRVLLDMHFTYAIFKKINKTLKYKGVAPKDFAGVPLTDYGITSKAKGKVREAAIMAALSFKL
jgi:hypothetical protein